MNTNQVRVGVLLSPITPLWTGTVVAYTTTTFELEVTPKAGLSADLVGWFIDLAGKFVRIRAVDVSGANAILTLAPNGLTFTASDAVSLYNIIYPAPRIERRQTNVTTWAGGGVAGRFSDWRFTDSGGYTSLWWQIDGAYHPGKVCLHDDASMDDDSLVGVINKALGNQSIKAKNNSGLSGSVNINDNSNGTGTITIVPYIVSKDWDITWDSLGGTTDERDRAAQGPVAIVNPECIIADVGEHFDISADGSYATFDGANVPATIRYPATIAATDYVWTPGTDGTVLSGQNSANAHIVYSTDGFRYLELVITDSNSVSQTRYIPVWIGLMPTPVDSVTIPWGTGRDSSLELEFKSPPTFLRHSLVCLIDLDTQEPLYLGYAWPASVNYDFEKSTLRLTAYQALTFLSQVYYYPFILTGQKGGSIDWDHFDMYSVPRGAVFLLRWHSNYLTIANAEWDIDIALVPSGACCDRRLRYIQPFNAGTLYDELKLMAQEAFYSIYPRPLGGFRVIPSLLYGSAITGTIAETGVDSDTLTLALTGAEMRSPVDTVLGVPTMSEGTLWGNYHTGFPALNFYSIKVKAPKQPEPYGRPAEVPNLLSSTTNAPGDPGYWEMLRWAGRHVGLANYADTYSLRPLADVDVLLYPMVDIADPADPLATIRVVVESKTIEIHPDGHADIELTGRDFGITVSSVVAPADPTPGVDPPGPIPIPNTLVADFEGVPTSGFAPLTVAFTDLTTGGTPTEWAWDFGDGATDTAQNPANIYTAPGLYTVSLTATTAIGDTDTETKIEYIEVLASVLSGVGIISNGSQIAITNTYDEASPTWFDATPGLPAGAGIQGYVVHPSDHGAWLLTTGGSDPTLGGVFRCDDITVDDPVFSLVYSQAQAAIDAAAALLALGWVRLDVGEMGSLATGANGEVVVVERKWDGFADRDPSCVFVSVNSGGSFSTYVPSGSNPHRFWADVYLALYGCHSIWWDGSQYIIAGTTGYPFFHAFQAIATSADGVSWIISEASAPGYECPRSYSGGCSLFDNSMLVQLPTTDVSVISYTGKWYHHFDFGGLQCYLHEDATPPNTRNYLNVGGSDVVDSVDVFGSGARIGGAALRAAAIYVLVPLDSASAGMVVCERSGGINTDKTGNLLSALGGSWAGGPTGHYDNCQVEVY